MLTIVKQHCAIANMQIIS